MRVDVEAPGLVRSVRPGPRRSHVRRTQVGLAAPQEVPGGGPSSAQNENDRQNDGDHFEQAVLFRDRRRRRIHRYSIGRRGRLARTVCRPRVVGLAHSVLRRHPARHPGRHRSLLVQGLSRCLHRGRRVPLGSWLRRGGLSCLGDRGGRALRTLRRRGSIPPRGGPLKRASLRCRSGRPRLVAAILLGNLRVSGSGGRCLLGCRARRPSSCPHRHRRSHRADLARDRRLRRLRRLSATTGLARQHLPYDGVVGLLQYLADPRRDRRVGRQDRVQVGASLSDPLEVLRRGEPAESRCRVVVASRR